MTTNVLNHSSLSEVLNRLLFQQRIRVTELARRIGISQPTLQRMLAGTVKNPHNASLEPLANYFQVSIEQLKGLEPIPWLQPVKPDDLGWTKVPLLSWSQAVSGEDAIEANESQQDLLFTDAQISAKAFALRMKDASMEPLFSKGSLLIIDREKIPKDRSYVVVKLKDYAEVVFRQLIIDGPNRYLKSTSPDFDGYKMTLMREGDIIIGVLAQARKDYEE